MNMVGLYTGGLYTGGLYRGEVGLYSEVYGILLSIVSYILAESLHYG